MDTFLLSMNWAAEKAESDAKAILWKTITQMTSSDAHEIIYGRDDEATRYFQCKTRNRLEEIFKPTVHEVISQVGVTRRHQKLDAKVRSIPLAGQLSFDLDQYATEGALKGLFHMLAQEEKKIRRNPTARITPLLQRVFGAPREG